MGGWVLGVGWAHFLDKTNECTGPESTAPLSMYGLTWQLP